MEDLNLALEQENKSFWKEQNAAHKYVGTYEYVGGLFSIAHAIRWGAIVIAKEIRDANER